MAGETLMDWMNVELLETILVKNRRVMVLDKQSG